MRHRVEVTDQGLTRATAIPKPWSRGPAAAQFISLPKLLVRLGTGLVRVAWERRHPTGARDQAASAASAPATRSTNLAA